MSERFIHEVNAQLNRFLVHLVPAQMNGGCGTRVREMNGTVSRGGSFSLF